MKLLYSETYKYTFVSVLAMNLQQTQLFMPSRTRCFQQPPIPPPRCQWKDAAAAAKSIALLWQHIPLPWGPRCLGDVRRAGTGASNGLKAAAPPKSKAALAFRTWAYGGRWPDGCRTVHSPPGSGLGEGDRVPGSLQALRRGYDKRSLPVSVLK